MKTLIDKENENKKEVMPNEVPQNEVPPNKVKFNALKEQLEFEKYLDNLTKMSNTVSNVYNIKLTNNFIEYLKNILIFIG
jgi:hypothetical protein